MTDSPWTPDVKARALELAEIGMKAEAIGAELRLTKNQVIGWFNRNHRGALLYSVNKVKLKSTMKNRLQVLNDKMDRLLEL